MMSDINTEHKEDIDTITQATSQPAPKVKKKKGTKVVFYLMAIMLLCTTAMSGYMTYKMYIYSTKTADTSATDNNDKNNSNSGFVVPDNYHLISDKDLEAQRNESYYIGRDTLLDNIKTMAESGKTTLRILRTLYPEYLVYSESSGYIFKEINTGLVMHDYDASGFKMTLNDSSVPTNVEYYENDQLKSFTGIDVSKHNKTIDWAKVKNAGIDFAIIRAGNRGYGSEGKLLTDPLFEANAKGATENGIPIGAYMFSEAITVEEAIEEADLILSMVEPYDITYPIIIDIEEIAGDDARNEALTPTQLTDVVLAFCNRVKEAGYTPMIYANLKGMIGMLEFERLEGIEKWYAYYGDELYFPYDVSMWQYTSSGYVDGIEGKVDLNISFKDYKKDNTTTD
ncbi:MAG: glycoside hydrolase family 25 protein [Lachnospiraceae bacterium]|nr:glycoside hydrolase family 25 protein [Lachnospiraceae bacterium]